MLCRHSLVRPRRRRVCTNTAAAGSALSSKCLGSNRYCRLGLSCRAPACALDRDLMTPPRHLAVRLVCSRGMLAPSNRGEGRTQPPANTGPTIHQYYTACAIYSQWWAHAAACLDRAQTTIAIACEALARRTAARHCRVPRKSHAAIRFVFSSGMLAPSVRGGGRTLPPACTRPKVP